MHDAVEIVRHLERIDFVECQLSEVFKLAYKQIQQLD